MQQKTRPAHPGCHLDLSHLTVPVIFGLIELSTVKLMVLSLDLQQGALSATSHEATRCQTASHRGEAATSSRARQKKLGKRKRRLSEHLAWRANGA